MIIPHSMVLQRRKTGSVSAPIACSVLDRDIIHLRRVNLSGRALLSDKKPLLSQFYVGPFLKRVCIFLYLIVFQSFCVVLFIPSNPFALLQGFRVSFNCSAHLFAKFVQEQMLQERKNEESVNDGTLTVYQADILSEEWENVSLHQRRN